MESTVAAERAVLGTCLDDARAAVVANLANMPSALLREPLVSSGGSLLGIVKHLAHLERWWFAYTFAGLDVEFPWTDDDPDADWRLERGETARSVVALYDAECQRSRMVVAAATLDDVAARSPRTNRPVALRWVLLRMIAETSRHAGHADLLRQLIDGDTSSPPCSTPHRARRQPHLHRHRLSLVDVQRRRLLSERSGLTDEGDRCRHREMRPKRVGIAPMLQEHEAVLVFSVAVDGVEEAARLPSRAVDVLEAQLQHTREVLALRPDAAGDDEHRRTLPSA